MPNPFFFAGKITNPEHFVGREKELKKIFGYLDTSHTGQIQHASVVGERRIGKSSLLYHISQVYEKHLPDHQNYRFVYIDLDKPNCHTQHGLLRYILEQLDLPAPREPSLERFYELIEQKHEKEDFWPVFLIDEFEHLSQRTDEFPDSFYDALRSLGNNNLLGIVTASQHPLQGLAKKGKLTSPFFNIFHKIDLGDFTEIETDTLLNRGRLSDQSFTDGDCQQIINIAGKHPACLQIVSSLVYEAKANSELINWKVIEAKALKEPPFIMRNEKKRRFIKYATWLFWDLPKLIGHAIMVVIGRGEHTDENTDRIIGYIAIAIPIMLWLGIISWPLVTKYIRRLSELFFQ